jgi:hypothetical protein
MGLQCLAGAALGLILGLLAKAGQTEQLPWSQHSDFGVVIDPSL